MAEYQSLGKLNTQPLIREFGKLQTDEIILTKERSEHIRIHHPQDYSYFEKYGIDAVTSPDEILRDLKHDGTIFMVKHLSETNLNVVVRLALDTDQERLKNSVMTFFRIRERNLVKLRNKNKMLYI